MTFYISERWLGFIAGWIVSWLVLYLIYRLGKSRDENDKS